VCDTYTNMKNIRGYTEHLRETNSMETPKELGKRLLRLLDTSKTPNIEEVKRLIDAGAELDAKNNFDRTPLYIAAANGHAEITRLLIDAGAELDARNKYGRTPLYAAAANGHTEIAKLLIDAGAKLDARDKDDWTPLHYAAAIHGHTEIARLLIQVGAELDVRDQDGWTPLYHAAANGRTEIAKLLIDAGADILSAFDSLEELKNFFGGDISWVPLNRMPPEWRRGIKTKNLFGV
jgi:ankyrin repeat protein